MIKNKYLLIIMLFTFVVFFYIQLRVMYQNPFGIDKYVWDWIKDIRRDELNLLFSVITRLADAWFLVLVMVLLVIYIVNSKKDIRFAVWFGISALSGGWLFNHLLKNFYQRPRPFVEGYIDNIVHASAYSFPSGHSMGSAVCYVLIAYLFARYEKNKFVKFLIYFIAVLSSVIIAFSRVYLGVHYPSDVVAGFMMGITSVIIFILIYRRLIK